MSKRIEKLDRVFDLMILLASIISATLFQFVSSIPYSQDEVAMYEHVLKLSFRLFLIPVVLTITMWISAQLARRQTPRILLLKTCAWTYSIEMVCLYLFWAASLGFANTILTFSYMAVAAMIISAVMAGLLLRFVTREYEKALNWKVFKTRDWLYRQVLTILVALLLGELSILVAFL